MAEGEVKSDLKVEHAAHHDLPDAEVPTEYPDPGRPWNFRLILSCIAVGASSILFGYDDKIVSPVAAMAQFVDHFQGPNSVDGSLVLTSRHQSLVFSVPLVGAIVGAAIAAPITTRFGRKWPIIVCYFISYGSTFLQTFAPNIAAFVVGRLLNAFIMAIAMTILPLYLSELVPAKYRGRAVTSANIFNLISGVIGTIIADATHTRSNYSAFRIPLALQAVMPTVLIPLTIIVPESPLWLLTQNKSEQARISLRKLRAWDEKHIDEELAVIKLTHSKSVALSRGARFFDQFNKQNLERTLVAGSMYSINQVTGVILSTTYATVFLVQLGVGNAFELTIAASCCTLAGTIIAPFTVDRFGRRPTALVGMIALMIIDFICGALAFFIDDAQVAQAIAGLSFLFNVFWAASFYPLSLALPAEIPTPRLRNMTSGYTLACAYITAVITTFAVPQLTAADAANLGAKTYLVFGGLVAIVLVIYYFYLPETSGRTLPEIDEMYEKKVPPRQWKNYVTSVAAREGRDDSEPAEEKKLEA